MHEQTRQVQGNLPPIEDELDELFIQLDESDEGQLDISLERELVESMPNSTSRDGSEDNRLDRDSTS